MKKLLKGLLGNCVVSIGSNNSIKDISNDITTVNGITKSTTTINGKTYEGSSVSIIGDKVIVDGIEQDTVEGKNITIEIHGDVESIETGSGDVSAQNVNGYIKTASGDIDVQGDIEGNVSTMSGDVSVSEIGGSVSTMSGDVDRRFK